MVKINKSPIQKTCKFHMIKNIEVNYEKKDTQVCRKAFLLIPRTPPVRIRAACTEFALLPVLDGPVGGERFFLLENPKNFVGAEAS